MPQDMNPLQAFLAGTGGIVLLVVLAVLALVFLALWLRARGGGSGAGDSSTRQELKAAQNEARLAKGDLMQAKKDHEAQLAVLNKRLETLEATAAGRIPPELEEWKRRAMEAEEKLRVETERFAKTKQILEAQAGISSTSGTVIAKDPRAERERMERLEKELAETRRQLQEQAQAHQAELAREIDRLSAEKAAALTALSAEIASLRAAAGGRGAAAAPQIDLAALQSGGPVPDSVKFPYLEAMDGEGPRTKHYMPFGTATIGRNENNTIVLRDGQVSGNHATITFDGVDFQIKDNNSTNGTTVNGQPISTTRLELGDTICLSGKYTFRFGSAASDHAETDPAFAAQAYEAMVRVAPNFRPALQGRAALQGQAVVGGGQAA